ncbi:hypothetical protein I350_05422 [Cryptococcus amylolentus CBS 6273]|uniref:Uncharacterized protein n=1 Tax=Cryptococcus amylolentus CBS 6273 TaxID=1296118 RepID=A0A1E3JY34_9TREE|nr:hypothetical protein I350_05422 [Cryptococcus amylolentus CBS 6273]
MTGIPQRLRPSVPTISLIIVVVVKGGVTILDQMIMKVSTEMLEILCDLDSMLSLYLGTLLLAHLPIVAIYKYVLTPSVTIPSPPRPSKTRNAICIGLAHVYALIPLVPTLAIAGSMGFDVPDGFGIWWGYYCREKASWMRVLRIIAFSGPLVVALVASFLLFTALIATADHPSATVRPQARHWAQACFLFVCLVGCVVYLILEQVQGWNGAWWPRCFEGLPAPILLLSLLFDPYITRAYASWLRLRRPVDEEEGSAIGGGAKYYASSNSLVYEPQKRKPADIAKRSSSFWAPPRDSDFVPWETMLDPPVPRLTVQPQYQERQEDTQMEGKQPPLVDEMQMPRHPESIAEPPSAEDVGQSLASPMQRPSMTRYPPPCYQAPMTKLNSESPLNRYRSATSTIYSRASSYSGSESGEGGRRSVRASDPFKYATSTVYTARSFPFQLETELPASMPPVSTYPLPVNDSHFLGDDLSDPHQSPRKVSQAYTESNSSNPLQGRVAFNGQELIKPGGMADASGVTLSAFGDDSSPPSYVSRLRADVVEESRYNRL